MNHHYEQSEAKPKPTKQSEANNSKTANMNIITNTVLYYNAMVDMAKKSQFDDLHMKLLAMQANNISWDRLDALKGFSTEAILNMDIPVVECLWDSLDENWRWVLGRGMASSFLYSKGVPTPNFDYLAKKGALKNRHVMGEVGCFAARTTTDALEYLKSHGGIFDDPRFCDEAASEGNYDTLVWLRSQDPPCPWNGYVRISANAGLSYLTRYKNAVAVRNAEKCVQYINDNNAPLK